MIARSYLYVPGHRPERFARALASGSDAVIFDLEDAVPVTSKNEALDAVTDFMRLRNRSNPEIWVRVNTGLRGCSELEKLKNLELTGVVTPKATLQSLVEIIDLAQPLELIALIESAAAVLQLQKIAQLTEVAQFALGEVDLVADLGMKPSTDGRELDPLRIGAVVVSVASGLRPPIGPVWTDIRDLEGLASSTLHLRRLGFGARQAVHPSQIEKINDAMTPSAQEIDQAAGLVESAVQNDAGAFVDEDGRMIDEAVLRSARRLLE